MTARLEHIWLMSADMECDAHESMSRQLSVGLGLDELAFDDLGDGRVAVRAGFELSLSPVRPPEPEAYVAATFRLVYKMHAPASIEARRRFACEHALADAWPAWRAWVNGALAAMGLPPAPIPASLPTRLLKQGPDAFDLTLDIERKVARDSEAGQQRTEGSHPKPSARQR